MDQEAQQARGEIRVENVGGIDSTDASFSPGITVLSGRNATNRTSLLQAFRAVLGSENASLKGDSETGEIELRLGGETYTRQLERAGESVAFSGDPYLDDAEEADLFAFLLEDNEARKAVVNEGDLRDIIMRPVDTAAIRSRIEEYSAEKQRINARLDELEELKDELPALEARKRSLDEQLAEKEEALEAKKREIEETDADLEETKAQKEEREAALDALREARSDLETNRRRIESETESIAALEEELDATRAEYQALELPEEDPETLDRELADLRERKRSLESRVTQLQQIIQFNSDMLDETETLQSLSATESNDQGALTDQLLEEQSETVCWTCGSSVPSNQVEETIDRLRSMHREMVGDRNDLSDRIDELQKRRKEVARKRDEKEAYGREIDDLEAEIQRRENTLEELRARREKLKGAVEKREAQVNEFEDRAYEELLELQKELTELEFDLSSLQSEREDVVAEIESVEAELDEEAKLLERRDEVADELAELRTRIEDLERQAVEGFNEHMETVLDVLGYENLERIWIERVQETVRNGRRKEERTAFEMHIVRTTDDGRSYEDTIDHLSESEREVTGLVFALAGFLVHDGHEDLPVMLLDSLEALDSGRIAALVDYFSEYVDYLFVALLPEDAQALPEECERITEI